MNEGSLIGYTSKELKQQFLEFKEKNQDFTHMELEDIGGAGGFTKFLYSCFYPEMDKERFNQISFLMVSRDCEEKEMAEWCRLWIAGTSFFTEKFKSNLNAVIILAFYLDRKSKWGEKEKYPELYDAICEQVIIENDKLIKTAGGINTFLSDEKSKLSKNVLVASNGILDYLEKYYLEHQTKVQKQKLVLECKMEADKMEKKSASDVAACALNTVESKKKADGYTELEKNKKSAEQTSGNMEFIVDQEESAERPVKFIQRKAVHIGFLTAVIAITFAALLFICKSLLDDRKDLNLINNDKETAGELFKETEKLLQESKSETAQESTSLAGTESSSEGESANISSTAEIEANTHSSENLTVNSVQNDVISLEDSIQNVYVKEDNTFVYKDVNMGAIVTDMHGNEIILDKGDVVTVTGYTDKCYEIEYTIDKKLHRYIFVMKSALDLSFEE